MKTNVKTTIKGNENLVVKESVEEIFKALESKHAFILLTQISHNDKNFSLGIKKTAIKMFKQS